MAEVTDLWYYASNTEMAPVLPATDALFEERAGMSRNDALHQHPTGGEWVDTWLAALQEVGDAHKSNYHHLLTGVMLGMPGEHSYTGISESEWRGLSTAVHTRYDQLQQALSAWQFVSARTMASVLWDAMVEMYPHSLDAQENGGKVETSWVDLRPIFQ